MFLHAKLLKRINSSCSSGRERRKSVSGMDGRLIAAAYQGNLEMVKYCVANECPMDAEACAYAAESGHLEVLKYLREEVKAPWDWRTAFWRLKMVISTYSNILLSVKYDKYDEDACDGRPVRPLGLFEVLARNRQSALETIWPYEKRTRTTTPNVYNTSSTTTVLSQPVGDTKEELLRTS